MRKLTLLTTLALVGALMLSACHTTAGVGRDVSSAGSAITHSADKHSY